VEVDYGRRIVMQMIIAASKSETIAFDKERLLKTVCPWVEIAARYCRMIKEWIVHASISRTNLFCLFLK